MIRGGAVTPPNKHFLRLKSITFATVARTVMTYDISVATIQLWDTLLIAKCTVGNFVVSICLGKLVLRPVAQLYGQVRTDWNQSFPSGWAQTVHMFTQRFM